MAQRNFSFGNRFWRWNTGKVDAGLNVGAVPCLELLGAVVNHFDEKNGLQEKLRLHLTADGMGAELDSETVIPYGSEPVVKRKMDFCPGICRVTVDVSGGAAAVTALELDKLLLHGPWKRWAVVEIPASAGKINSEILWQDADKEGVFYQSDRPFLRLLLERNDNMRLEIGAGDDLWRMSGLPGCHFVLEGNAGMLKLRRQMMELPPVEDGDPPPAKRPWRCEWYFAWSNGSWQMPLENLKGVTASPEWASLPPSGMRSDKGGVCLVSAPARKLWRNWLRRSSGDLSVAMDLARCDDAAHLERPKKGTLIHWNAGELTAWYCYGNRQLARNGGSLRFLLGDDQWPLARVLSQTPEDRIGEF